MDQYRAETPRTIRLASLLLCCGRVALLILCLWWPPSLLGHLVAVVAPIPAARSIAADSLVTVFGARSPLPGPLGPIPDPCYQILCDSRSPVPAARPLGLIPGPGPRPILPAF